MRERLSWLFSFLTPYRGWILLGGLLAGLTVLGNVGLLATSAVLLSQAALMPPLLWLMPLITGVRFFGISRAVLRYAERLLNHSIAYRILGGLRIRLYQHLEQVVPDRLIGYSEGMLYRRLIAGIDVLQYFYLRAVSLPMSFLLVFVVACGFLSFFSKPAALILALGMALAGLVVPLATRVLTRSHRSQEAKLSDALSDDLLDLRLGLADLRLHPQASQALQDRIASRSRQIGALRLKTDRISDIASKAMDFIGHGTMMLALLTTMPLVQSGALEGVYLAMVGMVCLGAFEAVQAMPTAVVQMGDSLEAAKALKAVEDVPAPALVPQAPHLASFDLQLDDVAFHYHQADAPFLDAISLTIPHGQHVVFAGRSGSGKSSLAKIIAGLWTPDGGKLSLGGIDYAAIGRDGLSAHIGYLQQDATIFHASIRENLLLAKSDAREDELWQVLEAVGLKAVVQALPQGLETSLGEGGGRFSGGQRQRLAAARLMLQDPAIVILDEPGQNLDRHHANALLAELRSWARDKTLILITHRLEDLPGANFIYVLNRGKIVEKGTNADLLSLPHGQLRGLIDLAQPSPKEETGV